TPGPASQRDRNRDNNSLKGVAMKATYCHPIHYDGALDHLDPNALLVLRQRGTEMVAVEGRSMPTRSVRWRLASALIAAGAAAVAVLGLTVPAGAVTGSDEISPEQAGYTATAGQFKSIGASVYLRQPGQYAGQVARYGHSVQLWSSGLVVSLGVTASTSGGYYTPYATIYDRSTHTAIASNLDAQWCYTFDDYCESGAPLLLPGATLGWRIVYDPASG